MNRANLRLAFTLIELIIVVAIFVALIALLLPAVQKVRDVATRMKCANNLKQIALALHAYHNANDSYPPGDNRSNGLGFHVYILPYIEQSDLYREFNMNATSYLANLTMGTTLVNPYLCPSGTLVYTQYGIGEWVDGTTATFTTHYYGIAGPIGTNPTTHRPYAMVVTHQGNIGTEGVLVVIQGALGESQGLAVPVNCVRAEDIKDGASQTLMVGEISWNNPNTYRVWMRGNFDDSGPGTYGDMTSVRNMMNSFNSTPYNGSNNQNNVSFGSMHAGLGANFALADGSIRYLLPNISINVLLAASSRAGGELIDLP